MKLSNKYKNFLFSDPLGKILCVFIACFLWYYVNILSIEKTYISLPVDVINPPLHSIVDSTNNLAVRVEFSGYEDISRRIENIKAVIDLKDYSTGSASYSVKLLNLPNDIKATIMPDHYRITIYDVKSKMVPIVFALGKTNRLITNISYIPKEVRITGSSKTIDKITAISTEELDILNPIRKNIQTNVRLLLPRGITISNTFVTVKLALAIENFTNKINVPVSIKDLSTNLMITKLPEVSIEVITMQSNIDSLLAQSELILDFKNIMDIGNLSVPVILNAPSNVYFIDAPTNIAVDIISSLTNTKTTDNTNINIESNTVDTNITEVVNKNVLPEITFNAQKEPTNINTITQE